MTWRAMMQERCSTAGLHLQSLSCGAPATCCSSVISSQQISCHTCSPKVSLNLDISPVNALPDLGLESVDAEHEHEARCHPHCVESSVSVSDTCNKR